MVTDSLGNELEVGDLVQQIFGTTVVIGRVSKVSAGAIVTPGGQKIRPGESVMQQLIPGVVEIVVILTTNLNNPQMLNMAPNMVKVVDNNPDEREKFVAAHGARRTGLLV